MAFLVVPGGASARRWAPFFSQLMPEEAVERTDPDYSMGARVMDRAPTPSLAEFALIWWVFIDDLLVLVAQEMNSLGKSA